MPFRLQFLVRSFFSLALRTCPETLVVKRFLLCSQARPIALIPRQKESDSCCANCFVQLRVLSHPGICIAFSETA